MPAKASVAIASASKMSPPDGLVKRSRFAVSRSGSKTTIAPTTITASWRKMSASASTISPRWRTCPVKPAMLTHRRHHDHQGGHRDLRPPVREAVPDRAHVVRHRDGRQRDDDDVVDQDRPAGDEADQLVERVARERRGSAPLSEHRAALEVAERGEHEQEARGQEDQRRQPEPVLGDHADREVEREADRCVGDGEQPRHAEDAPRQRALAELHAGQPPPSRGPGVRADFAVARLRRLLAWRALAQPPDRRAR